MGKYKKLSLNILIMTVGQFSSRILSFLLVPLYTYILTTEEYGTYDLIVTTVTLLTPFLTLSVAEGVLRFCLDDKYSNKEVFSIGFYIVIIGTIFLGALYPAISFIDAFSKNFVWIILFFLANNIYLVFTQFLKGINKMKLYAVSGLVSTFTTLTLNVLFLVVLHLGIFGYLLSYVIGHFLAILLIEMCAKIHRYIILPLSINRNTTKDLIRYVVPMIPNSICWWISDSSDKFMVRAFISSAAQGIYSVSYKIPTMMSIFNSIFNSAWQISAVEDFGSEESKRFFSNIYKLFSALNIIVASGIICFSKQIAYLLYQKDFFDAWKASVLLTIAFVFNAISGLLGTIYTSSKKTSMLLYSTIIAAVINIVLNLILIPKVGIIGAAIATCFSYITTWLIRLIHSRKILSFKISMITNISSYILVIGQAVVLIMDLKYSFIIGLVILLIITIINCKDILNSDLIKNYLLRFKRRVEK